MNTENSHMSKETCLKRKMSTDVRWVVTGGRGKSQTPRKKAQTGKAGMGMVMTMIFISVALVALSALFMRGAALSREVGDYLEEDEDSVSSSDSAFATSANLTEGNGKGWVGFLFVPTPPGGMTAFRQFTGETSNLFMHLLSDAFGKKELHDMLLVYKIMSRSVSCQ